MFQNLQGGGGGGGGEGAIRVCTGQGSHCKMKVSSIFTIGPRSSRGVCVILRIRYLRLAKIDFST